MARINIENEWWTDERRFKLAEALGSLRYADGIAVEVWKLSQEFWGNGRRKIPFYIFKTIENYQVLLDVNLAVKHRETIYIRGTRQFHEWYALSKAASSKGGKSLKKGAKRNASNQPSETQVSSSSSSSISSIYKNTTTTGNLTHEDIERAYEVWSDTLRHFKIKPSAISPPQEQSLARAIKQIGIENVLLALEGARYEPSTENFNPVNYLSIERILHRDGKGQSRWEKFVNLANAHREKNKNKGIDYSKIAAGEL